MSTRDRDDFDPEDLIARARRGTLSRAEHEALTRALEASPDLAAAYRVGIELDRASAIQSGDEALIARSADAAMARVADMSTDMTTRTRIGASAPPRAGSSRWAVAAAALLSVVLASGLAGALWTGAIAWPFRSDERAHPPTEAPAKSEPRAKPRPAQPAPEEPLPAIRVEDYAPSARDRPRKAPDNSGGAAELFSEANAARRGGDLARARRTYAQLIERHPASDEAGLARVSLGKLLLAAGDARGAEREFRRYLAAGGGQLSEEALVGQAESLGRLKRVGDERAAWQRLLVTHPSSVYAGQAKQRLAALEETSR
jgi:tetratricopeptide (TPR) repeat protein